MNSSWVASQIAKCDHLTIEVLWDNILKSTFSYDLRLETLDGFHTIFRIRGDKCSPTGAYHTYRRKSDGVTGRQGIRDSSKLTFCEESRISNKLFLRVNAYQSKQQSFRSSTHCETSRSLEIELSPRLQVISKCSGTWYRELSRNWVANEIWNAMRLEGWQ
jgi:hypothetical protein